MKKFLFTLAALLMAGSVCAEEYLYIEDFEVAEAELGTEIEVPVLAHYDDAVSAWDVTIDVPAGMEITFCEQGADMTISYFNQRGRTTTLTAPLYFQGAGHYITAVADPGFYQVDGEWVSYGAVKWLPGDYEEMLILYITVAEDFQGGEITISTSPSCGTDAREDVVPCEKNQTYVKTATVTVEGGTVEPEVTEAPVITYNEETFTVTATGAGTVKLYVNGEEVENPYTFELGEEETTYTVTATAQEEGKEISETTTLEVTVPAAPVVIDVTPKPIIEVFDDPASETVTVRATGYGHICIYWDDQLMAEGDGVAEWVIPYCDEPEGEEYGVSATAQEEGYEVSEPTVVTVEVPGKSTEPQPYETPAPTVTTQETADAVVITVTGEGTVTLYVQYIDNETGDMTTETYEGEGTVSVEIPRGEEDYFINYWAVAQADEDAVPGSTQVEYFFEIPAKEEVGPGDDHSEGVWIVSYDKNGEEVWQELNLDNGDYTGIVRFGYGIYGTFDYYGGGTRPNVSYIFVVNGVRYGAAEDGTLTVLGDAMQNPLFEGENKYVLEEGVGKVYQMGIAIDEFTGDMYVYAAVAGFTDVEEMNASKTVAGVRYFNMAGQEMQEANGMTIVVTTYTDGTTSAVKVMK